MKRTDATEVIVADGILLFDQVLKRQVGVGSTMLIHPGNVAKYLRNGWIEPLTADDDEPEAEIETEPEPEPVKPARRSRK